MTDGPDLAALLDVLDQHQVAYVIAGSVAAAAHGVPDVEPDDLDVVPATDEPNLSRLFTALTALAAEPGPEYGEWHVDSTGEREWVQDGRLRRARPIDPRDAVSFDHSFQTRHGRLDIVPVAAGTFDDLHPRTVRLTVGGTNRPVASAADLLASMTRPRRDKDAPRVRHLRAVAAMPASAVGFVGLRTPRFNEMVALFADVIGLQRIHEAPGATWFRLGPDAELHVYAEADPDHAFFTTGPVVGLRVADVDATRAELEWGGVELLTDVERTDTSAWCHFRAPDGTVLEIVGPAVAR